MTQVVDLNGNIRSLVGKNVGSKLLRVGKIPAVIYGENGEPNINIELDIKEFEKEYFKGNVELKMDINGNVKPSKEKEKKKIDSVISMITALGGYLQNPVSNDFEIFIL